MRHGLQTLMAIAVATPLSLRAQSIPQRVEPAISVATPMRLGAQSIPQRVESTEQVAALTVRLSSHSAVQTADAPSRFATVPASILGSAIGFVGGARLGSELRRTTGCCFEGGDDPGLAEQFLGALAGATIGSALLGWAFDDRKPQHTPGDYFTGAVAGILPGIALGAVGIWLFDNIDPELPIVGLTIGFSVGQGTTTALVGSRDH
jgi:hypothetical protein